MSSEIKGTVSIDLSTIGLKATSCAVMVQFDSTDRPIELRVEMPMPPASTMNRLMNEGIWDDLVGQRVAVALEDGRKIEASVEFVKGVSFANFSQIVVTLYVGEALVSSASEDTGQVLTWEFSLANLTLRMGDERTEHPLPPNARPGVSPGGSRDWMSFAIDGREWRLRDTVFASWKKKDLSPDVREPVLSGILSTLARPDDSMEMLVETASDIECLLMFALGRDVRWTAWRGVTREGHCLTTHTRNVYVMPFNASGLAIVDNWEPGVLKAFMEAAHPNFAIEREWWSMTMGLFQQAMTNKFFQIKAALLNILLDRIATRLGVWSTGPVIDKDLPCKLDDKEFSSRLHALFAGLTPKWEQSRTDSIIGMVKGWNARPSFPEGIKGVCRHLGIPEPPGKLLKARHMLLHIGELKLGADDAMVYWTEIEFIVVSMLLRMLKYDGKMYHHKVGHQPVILSEYLSKLAKEVDHA